MRTIFPYDTLSGDVSLTLGDPYADGKPAKGAFPDFDGRAINLTQLETAAWNTLELEITVNGPPTELGDRRNAGGDPRAHVVVHCSFTNGRQAVAMTQTGGSKWTGTVEVNRADWFGKMEMAAYITDLVDGERRLIGLSDRWQVLLDDLPRTPVHGAMTVTWKNFDAAEVEPKFLAGSKDEPYYHHIDPNEPVLYLNSGFEGLRALLNDVQGRREPPEQALHDQVRSMIATKFFLAAANAALASVRKEQGDPPDWPDSEWQRELLEVLLQRAFPKQSGEDALAEVAALLESEDGAGRLENMLIAAVDKQVGASRLLKLSIRRLGMDPGVEPATEHVS
jgi:predicted NUDIX family NTP pyrophosphohydrolase